MKLIAQWFLLGAIGIALAFLWHAHRGPNLVVAQERSQVTAARLYTGADGLTHVGEISVNFSPVSGAPGTVEESEHIKTTNAYVVRLAPGFFQSWHHADQRRYVVTLRGRAEIEVGNGEKLTIEPGQICLAEDLTGKGHTFRVVGNEDWVALFVDFAP
jgi:quercetin dioxygenase-like cupin family protein